MEEAELAVLRQQVGFLLAKMHSGSKDDMESACSRLAFIASKRSMHSPLLKLGTLGAVKELLNRDSDIVKASCASIIGSMATFSENKMTVVESGCGAALIATLYQHISQKTRIIVVKAIHIISSLEESRAPLFEEGAVPALLDVVRNDEGTVAARAALGALNNIASAPELKFNMIETGVIDTLISLLHNSVDDIKTIAVNVVINLAINDHNLTALSSRSDVVSSLMDLFVTFIYDPTNSSDDTYIPTIAAEVDAGSTSSKDNLHATSDGSSFDISTDAFTSTDSPPPPPDRDKSPHDTPISAPMSDAENIAVPMSGLREQVDGNPQQLKIQLARRTGVALTLISSQRNSHDIMRNSTCHAATGICSDSGCDFVTALVQCLKAVPDGKQDLGRKVVDNDVVEYCAKILANLSSNAALHELIMASGSLEPLVDILQNHIYSAVTQQAAHDTLSRLGAFDLMQRGRKETTAPAALPLINATLLASLGSDNERKRVIGEQLYVLVESKCPQDAPYLTGMLLQLDNSELLGMLNSTTHFNRQLVKAERTLVAIRKERQSKMAAQQQAVKPMQVNVIISGIWTSESVLRYH